MEDIVLIGYGGHAKSVADCIKRQKKYNIVGYTDLKENNCDFKYLGTDKELKNIYDSGIKNAAICIGYLGKGDVRQKIYSHIKEIGYNVPVIIDSSAIISDSSIIQEGTFIGKNVVINVDTKIGKCCIINTGAIIEHECKIDDFTHISVGAVLCGQVDIGKASLVGANATIIQCMHVPDNTIVPAGEVVRRKI